MTNKYQKEDPKTIQSMFGAIAEKYDKTNGIMSFQIHRIWNRALTKAIIQKKPHSYLDLCCGTGEIGYRVLKNSPNPLQTHFIDFCPEMIECAKKRAPSYQDKHMLYFKCGDAQKIPLLACAVDAVSIAYGVRNIKNPLKCFEESHRILKKGGSLHILELTQPKNSLIKLGHKIYLNYLLPFLGKFVTSNREAYEYLSQSIYAFSKPDEVAAMLKKAGFINIRIKPLTGGIATLISADKKFQN